jgi:hypothetical protein
MSGGCVARQVLIAYSLISALTGCSGVAGPANAPGASRDGRTGSRIAPAAVSQDLLYISYYEAQFIGVFAYPSLNAVGKIENIGETLGLCTDAAGDVFVGSLGEIREYKHGGTSPISMLQDGKLYARACSVDPTTGNLAVVSTAAPSGNYGNVAIYKRARGSPKTYKNSRFQSYFGCGYDALGNLYVMGYGANKSGPNLFAVLPKGGHALKLITLSHTPEGEGDVQWDGEYVAVSSPNESEIIQFQIKGNTGKEVGSTSLGQYGGDVEQFSFPGIYGSHMRASQVIGTSFGSGTFMLWNYPAGGSPIETLNSSYGEALGAVVSLAPNR